MRRWPRRLAITLAAITTLLIALWAVFRTPDIPIATLRAKYASPTSQFVTLAPGTEIHLRDEGVRSGFPIILLHGSNASLHAWEPWVARLKSRYRVITFDLPAHGLSGPVPSADYSTAAYVDITDKVVRHLGLARFAIGGNSMGGGVAWRYALAHPDRVAALILVDASGQPEPRGSDTPLALRIARMPVLRNVAASITPRSMVESSYLGSISNRAIATPAMIDRYWELLRYPGNRAATLDRFAGPRPTPASPAAITAPTAIIWGAEDKFIPVASAAWFSTALPNARVTILDDIGHLPMEEAPDRSLAPVLRLLESVAPATGFSASQTPR